MDLVPRAPQVRPRTGKVCPVCNQRDDVVQHEYNSTRVHEVFQGYPAGGRALDLGRVERVERGESQGVGQNQHEHCLHQKMRVTGAVA